MQVRCVAAAAAEAAAAVMDRVSATLPRFSLLKS